ncbi:MAG TPA: hypothetical protein VJ276_08420 [Thermoanaerobaculia bacterium]|nr:hypothetical protein [Thermoanaerobaculia bacterium]
MTFDGSPFTGNAALYAVVAAAVLVAVFALLGRSGRVKLPFFEASTAGPKKVTVAEALHVKKGGTVGDLTGAKTKGEGPQETSVGNNAVIEGDTGNITGYIEE